MPDGVFPLAVVRTPSPWTFGGPPEAAELIVGALAVVSAVSGLAVVDAIDWGRVAVGFLGVVVVLGPLRSYAASSGVSGRVGEFYDAIGQIGRAIVAIAVAATFVGALLVSGVTGPSLFYLGQGGLLAVAGAVAIKWIRHREIAG